VNLLYCELVIFVNFLYYKFVILVNLLYCELVISWIVNLWSLWSFVNFVVLWTLICLPIVFRFRPLSVYTPHRTFVSDFSEIPISFPFPELPFPILFPIKNMKTVMVLVFTDRFRPFSSLWAGPREYERYFRRPRDRRKCGLFSSAAARPTKISGVFSSAAARPTKISH
jgi:hypothetical protein